MKEKRDQVQGMGVVLDRLLAVKVPELGDLLGLAEFLASAGDEDAPSP